MRFQNLQNAMKSLGINFEIKFTSNDDSFNISITGDNKEILGNINKYNINLFSKVHVNNILIGNKEIFIIVLFLLLMTCIVVWINYLELDSMYRFIYVAVGLIIAIIYAAVCEMFEPKLIDCFIFPCILICIWFLNLEIDFINRCVNVFVVYVICVLVILKMFLWIFAIRYIQDINVKIKFLIPLLFLCQFICIIVLFEFKFDWNDYLIYLSISHVIFSLIMIFLLYDAIKKENKLLIRRVFWALNIKTP